MDKKIKDGHILSQLPFSEEHESAEEDGIDTKIVTKIVLIGQA